MKELLSRAENCFFQDSNDEGERLLGQLIRQADLDDDDELELVLRGLERGLFRAGCVGLIDRLAEAGFDFSAGIPGKGNLAVLCAESRCTHPDVFRRLVELGADPAQARGKDGRTVLHLIADQKQARAGSEPPPVPVHMLPQGDPEPYAACDGAGATPLHYAALRGNRPLMRAMLEAGADPNRLGTASSGISHLLRFDGTAPLHIACLMGDEEMAALLLEHGADGALGDHNGRGPSFYALSVPHQTLLPGFYGGIPGRERIIDQKARILGLLPDRDSPDAGGASPLLFVLLERETGLHRLALALIALGADPARPDHRGVTPLMPAAARSYEVMKALVAAGVPLDAQDRVGDTALHWAVRESRSKEARYLVKKGARHDLPNNRGETALDLAAARGLTDLVELALG